MKPLHLRPLARHDVDAAAGWYASQGGRALELAFIEELEAAADLIARHPGTGSTRHATVFPDLSTPLRFFRLRRFDRYLLYYLEFPTHLEIVRVWDAARDVPTRVEETRPGARAWQPRRNEPPKTSRVASSRAVRTRKK